MTTKKILLIILIGVMAAASLVIFEFPSLLIRPVVHADIVEHYAETYKVNPFLIMAIIKEESNFSADALSHRGATGLMQIMPATALELAEKLGYHNFELKHLQNPKTNIHLGTYYIAQLLYEFHDNKILALAAYNAGSATVQNWYRQNQMVGVETADIPYDETRAYVRNVLDTYRWLSWVYDLKHILRKKKNR